MQGHPTTTPPALVKSTPSTVPLSPIHEAPASVTNSVATPAPAHAWKSDAPASLGAVGINLLASMLIIFLLLFGLMAWLKQNPKLLAVLQQWQGAKSAPLPITNTATGLPGAAFMTGATPSASFWGNVSKRVIGLYSNLFGNSPTTQQSAPQSPPPSLALQVLDETWLPGHQSALCWVKAGPQVLLMSSGLAQAPQVLGRMPYEAWQQAARAGTLPQSIPQETIVQPPLQSNDGFVLNLRKNAGES